MESSNKTFKSMPIGQKFATVLTLYLTIASFLPQLYVIPGYQLSIFLVTFLWLFTTFIQHPGFYVYNRNIGTLLIVGSTVLIPYIFNNGIIGNRYLAHGIMIVFYLIYMYNEKYGFSKSNEIVIKTSFPLVVYTSVITLVALLENPYISRSIKSSGEYSDMIRAKGVGGYEFIYFLTILSVIIFYRTLSKNRISGSRFSSKSTQLSLLFLFVVTIVFSNYLTALMILIIAFSIIIFARNRSAIIRITYLFTLIILTIFSRWIGLFIIDVFMRVIGGGSTYNKLLFIKAELINSGSVWTIATDRIGTLNESISSFIDNILFGIVVKPIEFSGGYLVGFGQHSFIFDTLALFGMIIGSLTIFIYFWPLVKQIKKSSLNRALKIAILISATILFVFNNATISIGYALYFIYPYYLARLSQE